MLEHWQPPLRFLLIAAMQVKNFTFKQWCDIPDSTWSRLRPLTNEKLDKEGGKPNKGQHDQIGYQEGT